MIDEDNFDFVGPYDSAWEYYRNFLDSGGNKDQTIKPTYIGKQNENGKNLYGVKTVYEEGEDNGRQDQ